MNENYKNYIAGLFGAIVLVLGGYFLPHPGYHFQKYETSSFEDEINPGDEFKTYIPDMDVLIHFRPIKDINKDHGTKWTTYAYTVYPQESKLGICEINLPSGKSIHGVVNDKTSWGEWFNSQYFNQAIAHELLHCIKGDFHE